MCFPTLQWLFPFSLLFHLISSIQKLGCEPETDLPGRLQWLSLARPPLPWSQPLLFAHDCTREDLMYIAVTQQRVIIHHSHASNISLGHVFSILLKKKKNQQQPRRHCCLFSRFSDRPNQQKSGPFCSHCQKNISSTLCCSFPGKTQNSLKCTYFQTATLNQTWDWIYCKRLPLGHESYSNAVSAILSDCSSFTQHPREIYFT